MDKSVTVRGLVLNYSNVPLAGVTVRIRDSRSVFMMGTYTDSTGMFVFTGVMEAGTYSFMFTSPGYRSQTLSGCYMKKGSILSMLVRMINSAELEDD